MRILAKNRPKNHAKITQKLNDKIPWNHLIILYFHKIFRSEKYSVKSLYHLVHEMFCLKNSVKSIGKKWYKDKNLLIVRKWNYFQKLPIFWSIFDWKRWFHGIFDITKISTHSNTVWKNEKFGLTKKIFRQINSLVICLVKPLLSRNFCWKSVKLKFHNFHTVSNQMPIFPWNWF